MNHSFQQSQDNLCAKCHRSEIDHSDNAQCEACPVIGPCDLLNGMLLCASCFEHDKQLEALNGPLSNDRETKITQIINRLGKEIPIDRRQYFVGRITAIVDIERQLLEENIENPQYALAQIVEGNLSLLKQRLAEKHAEIRELQGESVADQKYLNMIVPQLREAEREKFKAFDISYKPSSVVATTSTSRPRQSASDKAVESFAKMMGITVEQAKLSMANAMKNVTGAICTCQETPGICKVHPK